MRATVLRATGAVLVLATAACGDDPIRPSVRTAIEDACEQVYLLRDEGTDDRAKAVESVLWGQTQSAMASSIEERAEPLAGHLAEMKRILVAPDARSANPAADLAAFDTAHAAAVQDCGDLEEQF